MLNGPAVWIASPGELSQMITRSNSICKFATDKNGMPQVLFKPEGGVSVNAALFNFTITHVKRPSINDTAIVLYGKHRGEHVIVL